MSQPMGPIGFRGAPPRLVTCACCWGPRERLATPPKPGAPPVACAKCERAGCRAAYAGYWKRGKECPRAKKHRKAGRMTSHKKAEP